MNTIDAISNDTFRETIDRAIKDVFRTMVSLQASPAPGGETNGCDGLPLQKAVVLKGHRVLGNVGFQGDLNGMLGLCFDTAFANSVTGKMLGMTDAEVTEAGNEVTNDTIGELTNMAAGAFKNQLADRGHPCKLTIPAIVRGDDLAFEPHQGAVRRVYRYDLGGQYVYIDFQIKETAS
ncbi:chemotaxis protein CheX [Nibricoccus sp. IMCC34717]|uniref:chemotaxis protein CheX n=1 Tax=Nibricoccus sp. IMCC34717 TaxID=3034021 RepID=UPI0038500BF8